jgi:hypothetical protein
MVPRSVSGLLCVAFTAACGSAAKDAVPPATMSPVTPAAGDLLLRFDAKRALNVERFDDWNRRWDFLCTTPCERVVPAVSAYRVRFDAAPPSQSFTINSAMDPWMVVEVDPRGLAGIEDSPALRKAHREMAEEIALAPLKLICRFLSSSACW